jgi:hypothetical protein
MASRGGRRRNGPDVVREVNVVREPRDGLVCLRKRCPSLEDKVRSEGCPEDRLKRPDDPDVLLKEMY